MVGLVIQRGIKLLVVAFVSHSQHSAVLLEIPEVPDQREGHYLFIPILVCKSKQVLFAVDRPGQALCVGKYSPIKLRTVKVKWSHL